jgi:hypothetical protein
VCIDKVFPNAFLSTKSWKKDEDADITQLSTGKNLFVSFAWENVGQRLFFLVFHSFADEFGHDGKIRSPRDQEQKNG